MIEPADNDREAYLTTDGAIAVNNLDSARRRSWARFYQNPLGNDASESVIEHEKIWAQFLGDLTALDRLEFLAAELARVDGESADTALIQARIASTMHQFSDAQDYLAQARRRGAPPEAVDRLLLDIDQACGVNLDRVLDERARVAEKSGRLEDLLALGAALADCRKFIDADQVYRKALREYREVSPFPVAWANFQLGVLWGELTPEPQWVQAERWHQRALDLLPGYVKARVHLAEVYLRWGRPSDAEAALVPAMASADPEVRWRLADALVGQGRSSEARAQIEIARSMFEALLNRHLLAFADHGAEFYAGSGDDHRKALCLARVNVANRPTLRAFESAHEIAARAGDTAAALELFNEARTSLGARIGFGLSSPCRIPVAGGGTVA